MNFASDNVAGAHPALLQALADINDQTLNAYGEDPFNAQVEQECRRIFEHDRLKTVLVGTGSAANALALATMTPAWGAIYCHRTSHIVVDEATGMITADLPANSSQGYLTNNLANTSLDLVITNVGTGIKWSAVMPRRRR